MTTTDYYRVEMNEPETEFYTTTATSYDYYIDINAICKLIAESERKELHKLNRYMDRKESKQLRPSDGFITQNLYRKTVKSLTPIRRNKQRRRK